MSDQWIDGHLDIAYLVECGHDVRSDAGDVCSRCVSLPSLRDAGVGCAFATIFTWPRPGEPAGYDGSGDRDGAERAGLRQLEIYERLESEGELSVIRSSEDLLAEDRPEPRIVILMEGADPIRSADDVAMWHGRGLRMVGLSWAAGTRYATGNTRPDSGERAFGLSAEGRELVSALDDAGIIHDVSHLSDRAFDDLLAETSRPVVATHSNCRSLLRDDERHLTDGQIRAIDDRGGVIGLNLFGPFLRAQGRPDVRDCVAHIEHIVHLLGHHEAVALGSDMDGGFPPSKLPHGIDHPSRLEKIAEELSGNGWSPEKVSGFRSQNWLRVLEQLLS